MSPKQVLKSLLAGNTVTYTVRRLRGYTHGDASFTFLSADAGIGIINIKHKLKCFRQDERPYDLPRWIEVPESA